MDLKTSYGFGLALLNNHIVCACSDSIIRVFNADTFSHITTLHSIIIIKILNKKNHLILVITI